MHAVLIISLTILILVIYRVYFRRTLRSREYKESVDVYTYVIASIGVVVIYRFFKEKLDKMY